VSQIPRLPGIAAVVRGFSGNSLDNGRRRGEGRRAKGKGRRD
jgi:hypothetical protein